MLLVDAITAQLAASGTVDRVEGALELQALVESGALPPAPTSAFVVPLGLTGGTPDAITGLYRQSVTEVVGVILAVRSAQPNAKDARGTLGAQIVAVIDALVGWQPAGATDVLRLTRGFLVSLRKGVALYQIEFSLQSQLRVTP